MRHLAVGAIDSPFAACMPALVDAAEREPEVRRFLHEYTAHRRQRLTDTIAAGIEAGDFPAQLDPEMAALALAGPIFYRRLMTEQPFDPGQVDALIETVLGAPRRRRREQQ